MATEKSKRRLNKYNRFYYKLNRNVMMGYLLITLIFLLLFFFSGSHRYSLLFLILGIMGMILAAKYVFLYFQAKCYNAEEINGKYIARKSRIKNLTFALILSVFACIIFLFLTEYNQYLSLIIPFTLIISMEYIIVGIDFFQISVLNDELSRD